MTQTIDLPKLKPAYLFAPEVQEKAHHAAEKLRRLAPMIRLRLDAQKESAQLDRELVPEPTPRTFTRSQLESGFANYPEKAKEPRKRGPKPTGVSRRWTSNVGKRGPKPMMGSGARR